MSKVVKELETMLGFNPSKKAKISGSVFKEILQELTDEETEKAKIKARELMATARKLHKEMAEAERNHQKLLKKWEKELGGILSQIKNDIKQVDDAQATEGQVIEAQNIEPQE
jgi:hypothetical protein